MATAIKPQSSGRIFDKLPQWHKLAPHRMVAKFSSGDTDKAWSAWQTYLMQRKSPAKVNFLKGKRPPLLWAWPAVWERDGILLEGRPLAQLAKELSGDIVGGNELPQAIQSLAIAYALPKLASKLSADVWWRMAESLCKFARDAQQLRTDPQGDFLEVLRQQLLAGELPLALAYLFPELQPMRDLQPLARQSFSEAVVALTDGKGGPHGRLLPVLAPLIACWTRARSLGKHLKGGCWSKEAETQYHLLLRHALRLAAPGGRFLTTDLHSRRDRNGFWSMLNQSITLTGGNPERAAAAALSPANFRKVSRPKRSKMPKSAFNSEWAGVSTLATGWTKSAACNSWPETGLRKRSATASRSPSTAPGTSFVGKVIRTVTTWS